MKNNEIKELRFLLHLIENSISLKQYVLAQEHTQEALEIINKK